MQSDLFADDDVNVLQPGVVLLRGFALPWMAELWPAVEGVIAMAPLRQMFTPGGQPMSVQTTSCGDWGWHSDHAGYRYIAADPQTDLPWPPMPEVMCRLARESAMLAGFAGFVPDTCLLNRYLPGARMGLHQDRDERDFSQPIVSVSLGLPAVFLLGGLSRSAPVRQCALQHGDVLVWGGEARLRFHGVKPVAAGEHPVTGSARINLTFRCAGF